MQYGAEVLTYQRAKRTEKKKKEVNYFWQSKYIMYFLCSLLISRVVLINNTAPFGIAFLIPILIYKEEKMPIVVGCGAFLGYMSLYKNINNYYIYIIIIASLVIFSYLIQKISVNKKIIILFGIILTENIIYNFSINNYTVSTGFLFSLFDVACIFPLYYMMNYAIQCLKDVKTKHLYSNEEIISMVIVASLVISGTWGATLYGISMRNILAMIFVVIISYSNGSSTGASAGIAIGTIVGMTSMNMIEYIGLYGLCGMIVGLFKDTGKWVSAIAYMVAFSILKLYSNVTGDIKLIEAIITSILFICIPNSFYIKMSMEFDTDKKQEKLNENNIEKIKSIFVERLDKFSGVLYNMSTIVNNLINNDRLLMKNKSSALIENLADRVCSNCDMNSMCWKRELHYTYSAFSELIQNYQENKAKIPEEIERKCIKRTALQKNTEEIVNNHIIAEMWRNRLTEGRQILAGQISNMAISINEIVEEFNNSVIINIEADKNMRRILCKKKIEFIDLFCFQDKNCKTTIKMSLKNCGGTEVCVKNILPLVNEATGRSMCISDEGCVINPNNNMCTISFEETPKFYVASYVARECKNGERYNGDSYSFGKLQDGTYMILISDGMGSGPEAGQESKAAVELIEKFTEAGFSKSVSINTVNSIMSLKFSEDEKFSTLDMGSIDLYTGDIDFMKVGAVSSYIKKKSKIEVINSKTLPIGVLDKVDVEVVNKKVNSGDIIVMMSDGFAESFSKESDKNDWIGDYLLNCSETNPKEILEDLMNIAMNLNKGKPKDDMTLIVSKVYNIY